MSLVARIEEALRDEHSRLRRTIEDAEKALVELESGGRTWTYAERIHTPDPVDRPNTTRGAKQTPMVEERKHLHSTVPLRAVWNDTRDRLTAHLDREATQFFRVGLAVARGQAELRESLVEPIGDMLRAHAELGALVKRARTEARFIHAVRSEFTLMATAFEDHVRVEEVDIYPALLGERGTLASAGPVNVRRSADEVARNLRTSASLNRVAAQEQAPPPSLVGRFKAWLQGE